MKYKILFIFVLSLTLLLTACGGQDTAPADTAVNEAPVANSGELDLPPSVDIHTVGDIIDRDDVIIFDVREPFEYDEKHIPGVTLIPLGEVPNRTNEIPKDKTVIMTCRSGNRSGQATDYLRSQGFTNVHNMEGGIVAWEKAGYPVEK